MRQANIKNIHLTLIRIGVLASFMIIVLSLIIIPRANAATNPANTYIVSTNTFYAYIQASENLDVSFTKILNTGNNTNSTVTISRPGAADTTCTLNGTTAVGDPSSDCILDDLTTSQTGIWRIHFAGGGSGTDRYEWQINAQNGAVTIPGRVWTEKYALEQTAAHAGIDAWYQSEYGYLYQATYNDYDGIDSTLSADGLGLVQPGTCLPLYKSINMGSHTNYLPPVECHSAFKLFFENPAGDLPATSATWDGSSEWVQPSIVTPVISDTGFTSSTTGARSGSVTFSLDNYTGPLTVEVDTNNNGSYNDPVDVSLPYTAADEGAQSVTFDGKDGNGNAIPTTQIIAFRITVDRVAEIHFLGGDIERRAGGIEVTRLNGPAGDETTIYWDDTDFAFPDTNRCPTPLTGVTPDGTGGVDSTGGVHAWTTTGCAGGSPQFGGNANNGTNGSWGDYRIIHDWAFVPTDVSATYTLAAYVPPAAGSPTPSPTPTGTLANTGSNQYILIAIAASLIIVPVFMVAAIRKFYATDIQSF